MADTKTRLRDAQQALELLEIQIEQLRLHHEGLAGHPHEADKARQVLQKAQADLARQRTYCDLLGNAERAEQSFSKERSPRVA
jgi:hypothetical protein